MVWLLFFLLSQPEILTRYESILLQQFSPHLYQSYKTLALRSGDIEEFCQFSNRLLNLNPHNPEIISGLAEGSFRLGKKSQGMDYLNRLFEKSPEEVRKVSTLLRNYGMKKEAIGFYERYRKKRKDKDAFAFEIASLSEDLGDYKRAASEIVKLLEHSNNPYYERTLVGYLSKTDPNIIIKSAKKIKRERTRSRVLARIYLALHRYKEADKELKKRKSKRELLEFAKIAWEEEVYGIAASLYQRLGDHINQAKSLEKAGKIEEALKVLSGENSMPAIMEKARLYLSLGNFKQASQLYKRIRGLPEARYGLVRAYIGLGELNKAEELLKNIRDPKDETLFWLFKINLYKKAFDSAQVYINRLAARYPESPLLNDALEYGIILSMYPEGLEDYIQASLFYETAQYKKGIEISKRIISSEGELSDDAYLLLARFYRAEGNPPLAISAYKELKEKFPKSPLLPKSLLEEALLYKDLKDEKRYRETLEELVLTHPSSPQTPIARELLESFGKAPMP